MHRPACLTIDESALAANLQAFRRVCSGHPVWAVAKARGYGHGIPSCVRGFAAADGLAVLELEEAVEARDQGWVKPLLLIEGVFAQSDWREALPHVTDLVVHAEDQLRWLLEDLSVLDPHRHRVWIKLNTGMNRLGFQRRQEGLLQSALLRLRSALASGRLGFMMHFASGEVADLTEAPQAAFREALMRLGRLPQEPVSLSNSAASLSIDHACDEWLRPGIALYGSSPFGLDAPTHVVRWRTLGMRAAASLTSRVIGLQELAPGEAVGYGGRFVAKRPSRIGVVAMGYADGFLRSAPDGTPVWVDGRVCPLAGRVSMDLIAIDLTDHPQAGLGSEVEFWGERLSVDEVAQACGTIGYELLTGVTTRVARRIGILPGRPSPGVLGAAGSSGSRD